VAVERLARESAAVPGRVLAGPFQPVDGAPPLRAGIVASRLADRGVHRPAHVRRTDGRRQLDALADVGERVLARSRILGGEVAIGTERAADGVGDARGLARLLQRLGVDERRVLDADLEHVEAELRDVRGEARVGVGEWRRPDPRTRADRVHPTRAAATSSAVARVATVVSAKFSAASWNSSEIVAVASVTTTTS